MRRKKKWSSRDESLLTELPPLDPLDFFTLSSALYYADSLPKQKRSFRIGDTSFLTGEDPFASVHGCWNQGGLCFEIDVDVPFQKALYPRFRDGDSIELFLDTRDRKSSGFPTRFSHHFLILPQAVDEISHREITRLHAEETRPLCDPSEIEVSRNFGRSDYSIRITIGRNALHGYDPATFSRLGFTYRINRFGGEPLHFAVSSEKTAVERLPSLWGTLQLKEKK